MNEDSKNLPPVQEQIDLLRSSHDEFTALKTTRHIHNGSDSPKIRWVDIDQKQFELSWTFFVGGGTTMYNGYVISNGNAGDLPSGWSSSRSSAGVYVVTHNVGSGVVSAVVTAFGDGASAYYCGSIYANNTNSFTVNTTDMAAALADTAFFFTASWANESSGTSDQDIYAPTFPCYVSEVRESHGTASTSGTIMLEKLTGTTAVGSGTDLFTTALSTSGTANTVQTASLTGTKGNLVLNRGDRLGVDFGGTAGSCANVVLTIRFTYN